MQKEMSTQGGGGVKLGRWWADNGPPGILQKIKHPYLNKE